MNEKSKHIGVGRDVVALAKSEGAIFVGPFS